MPRNTHKMANTASIRQSCDRCRNHKLRCERAGDTDTGACARCIRQNSQCVYSHSLPKGRPNQYRLAEKAEQNSSTGNSNPKRRANTPLPPDTRRPIISRVNSSTATATDATLGTANAPNPGTMKDSNGPSVLEEPKFDDSVLSSLPLATTTLPWIGSWRWNDLNMEDESGERSDDSMKLLDTEPPPYNTSFLDFFPSQQMPPSLASIGTRDEPSAFPAVSASRDLLSFDQEIGLYMDSSIMEGVVSHGRTASDPTKAACPATAALTQLSMRLHPLHSSSHALASGASSPMRPSTSQSFGAPERNVQIIDKIVFRSIMTQLVVGWSDKSYQIQDGGPTANLTSARDILQNAISASREFLDILACLQHFASGAKTPPNAGGGVYLTPVPTPTRGSDKASAGASGRATKGQARDPFVRHLVTACHGMLLSIYTAIFGVLQRDVEGMSDSSGKCGELLEDMDALKDMHLVMVMQLCSYLIGRQQQAVESYMAMSQEPGTAYFPGELEAEMQQGLARLKKILRIE